MRKMNNDEEKLEEENEKKPGKLKMFFEYYKYVPSFKALVKLGLYFIFFAIIISVVACNKDVVTQTKENEKTEEQQETTISYKEMLDALITNNVQILYDITMGEEVYRIDATRKDNILSGIYRTKTALYEFKIQDDIVYEIGLDEEKENGELLAHINLTYILPEQLVSLLESNKATKMLSDDLTIYNYEIDTVKYHVVTKDNWSDKIEITTELFNYTIKYNKSEVN